MESGAGFRKPKVDLEGLTSVYPHPCSGNARPGGRRIASWCEQAQSRNHPHMHVGDMPHW